MNTDLDYRFTGRERTRLRRARENGFLDAGCRSAQVLRDAHAFWCWRLRLPVIWYERLTPRSRYGRVRLDLFTTPKVLNAKGIGELRRLAAVTVSPHEARWERVRLDAMEELARRALRIALRPANYDVVEAVPEVSAGARLLPWKIPA